MRATVTIDDAVLTAAEKLAAVRGVTVEDILSELVKQGLESMSSIGGYRNGLPFFRLDRPARPITLEDVKRGEDEE
ncbi:MAG TPA: hypothetical protein VIL86_19175 [Tepidisphaeraceae bacterium]|jgi:hypothetical protein